MRAFETISKTDEKGVLKLDIPLEAKDRSVKIIILISDNEDIEEQLWLNSISNNPTFDFLKDKEEDIYSLLDGKPFSD